jgi:PAS domain S-box-containing protein
MMISNKKNIATTLWWIIGVSLSIHLLSFIAGKTVLQNWRLIHEPAHSSIEMSGSVIAILVAIFLVIYEHGNRGTNFNTQIAAALISMGLLDGIHACVQSGNTLVWVHSIATFAGGFFFVIIWLPKNWKFFRSTKWFLVALIISFGIGICSVLFPDMLPIMIQHGQFSLSARLLNFLGGILLFFSALRIVQEYFHSRNPDDLLFCLHCSLFGVAAIMFEYSSLWDAPWWSWHLLRFAAYIVALWFIILSEKRTLSELLNESIERKQIEDKLKLFNKSLEQRVLERTEELSKIYSESKESEARFQSIFSSLYEAAIIVYDRDGKIISLWGTPEMDKRYGICAVDAVGMSIRELSPPEQAEQLIAKIRYIIDTGTKVIYEHMITVPNGNFWQETSLSPMRNAECNIIAVVGFVRDITERKKMEERLKDSEEKTRAWLDYSPSCTKIVDLDFNLQYMSAAGIKDLKIDDITLFYGEPYPLVFFPESFRNHMIQNMEKVKETGGIITQEAPLVDMDGNELWFHSTIVPANDDEGRIDHIVIISSNITERKQAEDKLRVQNSYLKLLQVTAVAANEAEDIKDAFLPILVEICSYTGWEIGHAYAISEDNPDLLKPTEVWCLEEQKHFMEFCKVTKKTDFARGVGLPGRVLASGKPHWIVDVTKDSDFHRTQIALDLNIKSGIAFPVMVGASVVAVLEFFTTKEVESDQQFMDIMADVGTQLGRTVERYHAKEALVQSEQRFRSYFDLGLIGMAITSLKKNWVEFNDTLCNMFGYMRNDFIKMTWTELTHPDDLESDLAQFNRVLDGDIDGYSMEKRFIHRDGSIINAVISSNALRKADGSVDYFVALVHNITERKQMEEALLQSEKMKAMGIMTAGVAHEFNNILAVISSNAQLLEETNRSDKELSKSLHTICRMADDGAEIVDRMYDFTNVTKDTSHYISVDMNDLIKQVIGFTMPRWKEMAQASGIKYKIIRKGVKTLPFVLGSPSELRETILNIINNALDAMPEGGTITVSTRCVLSEQSGVESKKEKVSKLKSDFIEITFADTGNGMTHEVGKKMFDPFFTTRSPEGTGLGMSISYGIITRHGGKIKVESELGKGSVICLSLPVTDKSDHKIATTRHYRNSNIDNLNILVVDDKEEVSDSLSKILKDDGHKVCNVYNGSEAIKLLKKNSYDLLLCDLVMPDVNGRDIVNYIKTMKQRPKIGLITGWRYKIEDADKEGLEVDFIIKKPFNLSRLRRDINDLWV